MTSTSTPASPTADADIEDGTWRLDPEHSSVEFHVRHFYGLIKVKGRFTRYEGTVNLGSYPAIELTIDADSLDTKHEKRDAHLRSADFFDVEHHPQVRFVSDGATLAGDTLNVTGQLHAAGRYIQLAVDAKVRRVNGRLEIEAVALADHRQLGMVWSPFGTLRAPSKLIVRGRLAREAAPA
jgi:polyisoprenoid-binding protein YceI